MYVQYTKARRNEATGIDSTPQAYDSHCNVVLGDVEETIYMIEEDEEGEETVKVHTTDTYGHGLH